MSESYYSIFLKLCMICRSLSADVSYLVILKPVALETAGAGLFKYTKPIDYAQSTGVNSANVIFLKSRRGTFHDCWARSN
jgi:hypothetical protein